MGGLVGGLMFGKRFNRMGSKDHRFVPELMMSATAFVFRWVLPVFVHGFYNSGWSTKVHGWRTSPLPRS
jgi:hypothetical protein